jgi:tetratricopeptide (TPR) repeat protein
MAIRDEKSHQVESGDDEQREKPEHRPPRAIRKPPEPESAPPREVDSEIRSMAVTNEPSQPIQPTNDEPKEKPDPTPARETPTPREKKTEPPREPVRETIIRFLGLPTRILAEILILVALIVLIAVIYKEIAKDTILVEPFLVAKELQEWGYTADVITNKLMDEINTIRRGAKTIARQRQILSASIQTIPEVKTPIGNLPLAHFIQYTKTELLGQRPATVSGELTWRSNTLEFTVRVSDKPPKTISRSLDEVNLIAEEAARYVWFHVQPYVLASYLFDVDNNASLKIIKHILHQGPKSEKPWAYNLWGLLLEREKDYIGAIKKYQQAIDANPMFAVAYYSWGNVLYDQKRHDDAREKYRKATEIASNLAQPHYMWGFTLYRQKQFDEAIKKYKKAIDIDPNYADPYNNWGLVLYHQKQFDEAIKKYKKAIDIDPNHAEAYLNWGNVLFATKDLPGAARRYEAAIDINPQYREAYINCGHVLLAMGNCKGADEKYKKGNEIDPGQPKIMVPSWCHTQLSRPQE